MRSFEAYFYFVSWSCISLGFHVDLSIPNIEIHLPFGFFRIGFKAKIKHYTLEELNNRANKNTINLIKH